MGTRPPERKDLKIKHKYVERVKYAMSLPPKQKHMECALVKKKRFSKPYPAIHADANIHHANQREIRVGRKEAGQADAI